MTLLHAIVETAIAPALALLPRNMDSPEARVLLLAITGQEADFRHRYQVLDGGGKGPARGLWQCERNGGVRGVCTHSASIEQVRLLCRERDCRFDPLSIWTAIEHDDVLAAGVARLLLWTDPQRLPAVGDAATAWDYYARVWRPGKPHPEKWPGYHAQALAYFFPAILPNEQLKDDDL